MKVEPKFFLGAVPFALGILAPGASVFASQSAALTSYSVSQQVNKVSGVVTDSNGEPLIGVNVAQKGAESNGSITDLDGLFMLNVPSNATLVVSYVGFKTLEVPVNGKSISKSPFKKTLKH